MHTPKLCCLQWTLLARRGLNLSRGSVLEQVPYLFPAGQGVGSTGRAPTAILPRSPQGLRHHQAGEGRMCALLIAKCMC